MICLVTDFFGCVYNEYIILSCCGLEVDTIDEIIVRATCLENIPLYNINNLDNEDNDDIIKKKTIIKSMKMLILEMMKI